MLHTLNDDTPATSLTVLLTEGRDDIEAYRAIQRASYEGRAIQSKTYMLHTLNMAQLNVKGLHAHVPATSLTVLLTEGHDDTVTSVIPFQPVLKANERDFDSDWHN